VLVLLAAAVLKTATGDWTDACVIVLVIVVNTSAAIIQEVKADHAISALTQLAALEARVIRDGGQRQIPPPRWFRVTCWYWPRATSCRPTPR